MRTLDQLSESEIGALSRFITGCLRIRGTRHWRTRFAECARRGAFVPYVNATDQLHLRELIDHYGDSIVCRIRTIEVLQLSGETVRARQFRGKGLEIRNGSVDE